MSEKYRIIRAKRQSIGIRVLPDGTLTVRAPYGVPEAEIEKAVDKHFRWIEKAKKKVLGKTSLIDSLSKKQLAALSAFAKNTLAKKLDYYCPLMGVAPVGVTITSARSRFGSCSSKRRICFSVYLMLYPDSAIDYVVVHELAHLSEMNHSERFYAIVEKFMPDWSERKELLKSEYMVYPASIIEDI